MAHFSEKTWSEMFGKKIKVTYKQYFPSDEYGVPVEKGKRTYRMDAF